MIVKFSCNNLPLVRSGAFPRIIVINGGQGFVRKPTPDRLLRDARRIARTLPADCSFAVLGYAADPPPGTDIDAIVDAAAVAISDLAGGQKVSLLGISYGGLLACRVAARRPEWLGRLALMASGHRFSDEGAERLRRQMALIDAGDLREFSRAFTTLFRRPWLNALIAISVALGNRRMADGMNPGPAILTYLHAMLDAPAIDLGRIHVPSLILGGSADQFFGDGVMEEAAAGIACAQLHLVSGETHMLPAERPEACRAVLATFLGPIA
jgi:pimeloyl-ACP methyl ester carboxylesterase